MLIHPTCSEIFIIYANEDEGLLDKRKMHLKPLDNLGNICYDGEICPGEEWAREIYSHLTTGHTTLDKYDIVF